MNDFKHIQVVPQPKNLNVTLYQHQLASIYNMEKLEADNTIIVAPNKYKHTRIGVNADITGYGKTLSMIGLIFRDKMEWDTDVPFVFEKIKVEAECRIKSYEIVRLSKIPTTLVLMSQSIIGQWEEELSKTPLKFTSIKKKSDLTELQAEEHDMVLVIPTMFNKLVTVYSSCAWKRFIFDEPSNLKIPGMIEVNAGFYWFLTATPYEIFNHHYRCKGSFLRDIIGSSYTEFELLMTDIIIKNDPEFIKASFQMPKTYHHYYQCYNPIYDAVYGFVSESIKNMIECGNIEGAITALGGDKTDNIINLVKNKKEQELVEIDAKIRVYNMRNDETKVNDYQVKKNKILEQISKLDSKFNEMLNSPCNICYDSLKSPVLEISCQNLFCGECILKWLQCKNTCPLCRTTVDKKKLVYVESANTTSCEIIENKHKIMTKIEKILEIIKINNDGKYLIFSDHDGSFMSVKAALKENNISCVQIRGNIKNREKNLVSFKTGNTQVIFLNSKYNGAGINLQEATDIILYHEMNFNIETQIIGRANRIGRKTSLNVHHLQVKRD